MNLPEFSVKRGITTLMIFFAVVLVGLFTLVQIPLDMMPEMDIPAITVSTTYEGAGPEEIEEQITRPMEQVLAPVEDVDNIMSTSREGNSTIRIQFVWGTDLDARANDVRDAIDMAQRWLPEEADRPRLRKFDITMFPVMVVGVPATDSYEVLEDILEDEMETPLESIPGVASVNIMTPLERQINVDLDRERLAAYRLTPGDVIGAIARENISMSAGSIKSGYTDYLPRVPAEFDEIAPIGDIVLTATDGRIVRLSDVGEVNDGFREIRRHITVNRDPGGVVFVNKQADANTVEVVRAIRELLPRLQQNLPPDVRLVTVMDGAEDIELMIAELVRTLFLGGALAVIVVLIFLRRLKGTFVIALAIPFSLLLSVFLMYFLDYTLNMITLFAFIVVIGMVIDNAIIVLENITRHREGGENPREGAIYGSSEIAMAITASTLTTLCILFPLLFVRGIVQIIFVPFAVVAGVILLASLFSALTLTPMLASRLLSENFNGRQQNWFFRLTERGFNRVEKAYGSLLGVALRHRPAVVLVALAFLVGSFALLPFIGWQFMEDEDRGTIQGSITLPVGTRVEATREALRDVDRILAEEIPEKDLIAAFTMASEDGGRMMGGSGSHVGSFTVTVVNKDERDWCIFDRTSRIRSRLRKLEGIHSVEEFSAAVQDPMEQMITGGERALSVHILGDDMEATDRLADEIADKVREIPGTIEISISRERGSPELWVDVDREKAASLGLNASDVADTVRTSLHGREAGQYRVGGDEYDIYVRLREKDRSLPEDIGQLTVRTPAGELVRVEHVADVLRREGPVTIDRRNQQRVVRVEGNVEGRSVGEVTADIHTALDEINIPAGIDVRIGGEAEEMQEAFFWLVLSLLIGIILVYMVMASQFESLVHPFVIMFSLPFAFVGVAGALFLFGHNLTIIVFLGMLLLVGIVVNNAIVLVDYINILRARGYGMSAAIRQAGRTRLRPVLMTALTTIFALAPMAFRSGQGDEVWNPLGATIIGGLLFSTLITLILIPVIYSLLERHAKLTDV